MDHTSLHFALDDLPVPMVYATHRIIRQVNSAFASLFGYLPEELADRSFKMLYPGVADFVMVGDLWRTNFSGGRTYADERIMAHRDGTRFWCRARGKSMILNDPFARAVYCFDPIARPVDVHRHALTPRQNQILTLVAQGKTNAEIARELGLSPRSVETHRYRMTRQLGLKNTAELVSWFALTVPVSP
ncbi:helix-turn-helix transcriptional regulator [Pelagibacterium halotolerans]|uniref:Transcriptional regulator, LuxR family/sensory box protein n=1 Tax=Pelagibacterium halotolerans (strain DSM 22347 / JCM 15775 / CGMCC 1.7692 / B2) TaxID=1082931 RepID=G4R7M3_PELHB|nr:LuxR C-terminal-related transcriptional regulator [Pelagibacterium halotolerans]AEQ52327.1 transcriptional regulator, LuxR family/sensory box protein [Pelagibacterium halotolerans B2]QJR17933.1 PAS domain S-box protein [Pelagibacterium halotolerans]